MPRELKPCGTNAAYQRHRYKGENPCDLCVEGIKVYQRGYKHTEAYKAYEREYHQERGQTEAYKESQRRYRHSEAGKEAKLRHSQTEAYKATRRKNRKEYSATNAARETLPVDTETEMWLKENGTD